MAVNKKITHVSVDLGYGYVKGISTNGKRVLFPTLVGTGFDRQLSGIFGNMKEVNDLSNMHVLFDNKNYFVGDLAKESRTSSRIYEQERFNHKYTRILLNVAIQLLTEGKTSQINLSTGLPLSFYKAQAKDFRDSIVGMQPMIQWKSGTLAGETLKTNINNAVVFPQGASAIYSALINSNGKYTHPHLMTEGTLIALIDIGYRTTDFVVVEIQENGSFIPKLNLSNTLDDGVSNLHRDIEDFYKRETGGADLNEYHKARALKNGFLSYKGNKIDFKQAIQDSKNSIATNIADRLKAFWAEESNLFDAIFLAGGGGTLFEEYIQPHFDNRLKLISESQFANAIGYLRYGNSYFNSKMD